MTPEDERKLNRARKLANDSRKMVIDMMSVFDPEYSHHDLKIDVAYEFGKFYEWNINISEMQPGQTEEIRKAMVRISGLIELATDCLEKCSEIIAGCDSWPSLPHSPGQQKNGE